MLPHTHTASARAARRARRLATLAAFATLVAPLSQAVSNPVDEVVALWRFLDAADGCPYIDDTGGVGGQEGECTFTCKARQYVHVSVRADDEDADVAGGGECAEVSVKCGDYTSSCSATSTAATAAAGAGRCYGRSDEFWDSGIEIDCHASDAPAPDDPTPPMCILDEPVQVCLSDLPPANPPTGPPGFTPGGPGTPEGPLVPRCVELEGRRICRQEGPGPGGIPNPCHALLTIVCAPNPEGPDASLPDNWRGSSTHIRAWGGIVYGFTCIDGKCFPAAVECLEDPAGWTECGVGVISRSAA